ARFSDPGEVEPEYRNAVLGQRVCHLAGGGVVLTAGEAVREDRVGAWFPRGQLQSGGERLTSDARHGQYVLVRGGQSGLPTVGRLAWLRRSQRQRLLRHLW